MASVNDDLLDMVVRHSIYLERFKGAQAKKLVALFARVADDLAAVIAKRDPTAVSGRYTLARLEILLEDVRAIVAAFGKDLRKEVLPDLEELAKLEAETLMDHLLGKLPAEVETVRPSVDLVKAAVNSRPFQGRLLREYFADLDAVQFARVRDQIRIGVVEGEPVARIAKRVRGAVDINRRAAETVVRTAVSHTVNAARAATYEANDDIIKGVRWVSTLDGRTSAVCRARDGRLFPVDKGPRPPAHLNCRSTTTPVLKSWREMGLDLKDAPEGTRASINGQVPASETYDSWLRKQSAGFQDEVLGKAKGALFRRGGLTLDRFVDRAGTELNLDQLRAKYAEAFEKAGV